MIRRLALVAGLLATAIAARVALAQPPASPRSLGDAYQTQIYPLLGRYCVDCHGAAEPEGDLDLAELATWSEAETRSSTWQRVDEMLGNGLMPPEDADQPAADDLARLRRWVRDYLQHQAQLHAGDPGRVILRRLSNAEYAYTIRDLTQVESLDPGREFPADGAAGEGFTNTGAALVMSPELVTKYLDAAKDVASHAVLLPDGFRFSTHTTPRDWTDELLAEIRNFYAQYTDAGGGSQVNLQGVVFDTNRGGRLPVEKYLAATLAERDALAEGRLSIDEAAERHALNAKYLRSLWSRLTATDDSLLLNDLRHQWRRATADDAAALAAEVVAWQQALWTFSSVGLVGRAGGPKRWMEPVDAVATTQDVRFKIPEAGARGDDIVLSIVATDAGDGNAGDFVVWRSPRLVSPGKPDLPLRDVRRVVEQLTARRTELFQSAANCLAAANDLLVSPEPPDLAALAEKHGVAETSLQAWLAYLGVTTAGPTQIDGLLTNKLSDVGGYAFVRGWGSTETPLLVANSSDEPVRIPGKVLPHSVAVHPSPALRAAVGWRSPIAAAVRIEASVAHAHPECGNGVAWALYLRRGASQQQLAAGVAQGAAAATIEPFDDVVVRPGDVVSLSIGPKNGNHSCDLTAVQLTITPAGNEHRSWDLAADVANDLDAANPHADRYGHPGVWHFFTEPEFAAAEDNVPAGSLVARWRAARTSAERTQLAADLQSLLAGQTPTAAGSPDEVLYRQLSALRGPLVGGADATPASVDPPVSTDSSFGIDPERFGRHPAGGAIAETDLCVQAPAVVEVRLPADLAEGCELVATCVLEPETGHEGSAQVAIVSGSATPSTGLLRGQAVVSAESGESWLRRPKMANSAPILVCPSSAAHGRALAACADFRHLFPPALCYTTIVPVDEVISATLFHREDDHLQRLMLDDAQRQRLDRLWDELHFVSQDALTSVDAYEQLMEFATQDADPKVFEPMRQPIHDRAAQFRRRLLDCEPQQVDALVEFAAQAFRRPLVPGEGDQLRRLYADLRGEGLSHDETFRLTLARLLASPTFLYRIEKPAPGAEQGPVSDWELASRLSYFLWSSQPDHELRAAAASGSLSDPDRLVTHMHRMLSDPKSRRLAEEFACHWLQVDGFERMDEKSERHFPRFADLRADMAQEPILFFASLFQQDGSILAILDADYTFLNENLARHYGVPDVVGPHWRRVDGVKKYARGGVLAQGAVLAKQSGASRTSPILRGNWVTEVLLGERLPKPPAGVPPLPDDEAESSDLTVRQLVERHVSDSRCAVCHRRFDPYGFALEEFDAIGGHRLRDLGDRPIDTRVTVMDGTSFEGLAGLKSYLLTQRRDAFTRQFCRKLLGFALGRSVQLSDEPLLADMQRELATRDYRVRAAVEAIVRSRQFREIRGLVQDSDAPVQD